MDEHLTPNRESVERSAKKSRGQSMVELALVLPIIMLLLLGAVDFGFILYAHVQVAAAPGEGARVGSLTLYKTEDSPNTMTNDQYRMQEVKRAVLRSMGRLNRTAPNFRCDPSIWVNSTSQDVSITYLGSSSSVTRTGQQMIVEVRYRQPLFFNIVPGMLGDSFQVSSRAQIRIQ